jgi:hypothetical protein
MCVHMHAAATAHALLVAGAQQMWAAGIPVGKVGVSSPPLGPSLQSTDGDGTVCWVEADAVVGLRHLEMWRTRRTAATRGQAAEHVAVLHGVLPNADEPGCAWPGAVPLTRLECAASWYSGHTTLVDHTPLHLMFPLHLHVQQLLLPRRHLHCQLLPRLGGHVQPQLVSSLPQRDAAWPMAGAQARSNVC